MTEETFFKVKNECVRKMYDSFADIDELTCFFKDLMSLIEICSKNTSYIFFNTEQQSWSGIQEEDIFKNSTELMLYFTLFCRYRIDVIHELIKVVEFEGTE